MLKSVLRWPLAMALASCAWTLPAHAVSVVVDFEALKPRALDDRDTFYRSSFRMVTQKEGAIGLMSDCVITACPSGNDTQVYSVLNDGGITFERTDRTRFKFIGFDAGFIAPFGGLAGDFSPGSVFAVGLGPGNRLSVQSFAFTTDGSGFTFASHAITSSGFSALRKLSFFACTYNDVADCMNPNQNLGQFAIDNLQFEVATIPEPGTWALMGLGLAGLMFSRRRPAR